MKTAHIAKQRLLNSGMNFSVKQIADFYAGEKSMTNMDYKKIAMDLYEAMHDLLDDVIMSQDSTIEVDLHESIAKTYAIIDRYDHILS